MNTKAGHTQQMIERLIRAVEDGQLHCRVIAYNRDYVLDLMLRVGDEFLKRGFEITSVGRSCNRLIVQNCAIYFESVHEYEQEGARVGTRDCMEFWDNSVNDVR